jgi:putative ABC transport system permease protein
LTVALFIYLYVSDELSYDKWVPGYQQVVRLQPVVRNKEGEKHWATSEGFIVPAMATKYPEIEAGARIIRHENEMIVKVGIEEHLQGGVITADSSFFDVFPMTYVYGNKTAASSNTGVVITREVAMKFFGDIDPTGKSLTTGDGERTVAAVVEDMPVTSHLRFKVLVPMKLDWPDSDQSRNMYAFYSYLRLKEGVDPKAFEDKVIEDWYAKFGYADSQPESEQRISIVLLAMPLTNIHLQSHSEKEFEANGNAQVIYVFIGAGILLLVIAVINYINLSNAIAIRRSKEVAIRKTIGASKQRLFFRFMAESFMYTGIAMMASLVIVIILLPEFNTFIGKTLGPQIFLQPSFIIIIVCAWALIALISGTYPAGILSSYDPVTALKSGSGGVYTGRFSGYLRSGLIVTQFTISALMIVVSSVIGKQVYFIESKDVGFDKDNIIVLQLTGEAKSRVSTIKTELERVNGVSSVSASSVIPGKRVYILMVRVPDVAGTRDLPNRPDDGSREMRVIGVDHDFVKTMQLQMADGRDFSIQQSSDSAEAFILNEAAVKELNLTDPVGRPFEYTFYAAKKGKVVGVVKDFNFASVHSKVEPVVLHIFPPMYNYLCVRTDGQDQEGSLRAIESSWKNVTTAPFQWQFLDTTYDSLYRTEQTTQKVVSWFMTISMIIAGLGLFGIVTMFAQQRMREVGIRKVMGATQLSLMNSLSREYLVLVVIGNLLAAYPAFLIVDSWLQQFAFRIDLPVSTFVVSFLLSELLAVLSIAWIVFKTARMNPVSILRHE